MNIGILALQGDFAAHATMLQNLNASYSFVTKPEDLEVIDALILPGGESPTMLKFLQEDDFLLAIKQFAQQHPLFGTCAGAILLAKEVTSPTQQSLGLVDITVQRNAYGRQLDSHIGMGKVRLLRPSSPALLPQAGEGRKEREEGQDFEMVFIRAPKIARVGENVQVFATHHGQPVGVIDNNIMLTTFHPELSSDGSIHQFFIDRIV